MRLEHVICCNYFTLSAQIEKCLYYELLIMIINVMFSTPTVLKYLQPNYYSPFLMTLIDDHAVLSIFNYTVYQDQPLQLRIFKKIIIEIFLQKIKYMYDIRGTNVEVLQSNLNKKSFLPKTCPLLLIVVIGCPAESKQLLISRWCQNSKFFAGSLN